jgi:hypothetical protein
MVKRVRTEEIKQPEDAPCRGDKEPWPLPTQIQNKHSHPCFEWDSKPRSQRSGERKEFMPQTARPL